MRTKKPRLSNTGFPNPYVKNGLKLEGLKNCLKKQHVFQGGLIIGFETPMFTGKLVFKTHKLPVTTGFCPRKLFIEKRRITINERLYVTKVCNAGTSFCFKCYTLLNFDVTITKLCVSLFSTSCQLVATHSTDITCIDITENTRFVALCNKLKVTLNEKKRCHFRISWLRKLQIKLYIKKVNQHCYELGYWSC